MKKKPRYGRQVRETVEGKGKREDGGRTGVEGMEVGRRKEYLDVVVRSLSVTVVFFMYTMLHLGDFDTGQSGELTPISTTRKSPALLPFS